MPQRCRRWRRSSSPPRSRRAASPRFGRFAWTRASVSGIPEASRPELYSAQLRLKGMPASPPPGANVRRALWLFALAAAVICPSGVQAQAKAPAKPSPPSTDLDRFMATALLRRDIDRKTLTDYVLDEVEVLEVLGPGRIPFARMRYEYTWYVRDGIHVRSPLKINGVPIGETERRAYEDRWVKSEEGRR